MAVAAESPCRDPEIAVAVTVAPALAQELVSRTAGWSDPAEVLGVGVAPPRSEGLAVVSGALRRSLAPRRLRAPISRNNQGQARSGGRENKSATTIIIRHSKGGHVHGMHCSNSGGAEVLEGSNKGVKVNG